MEQNREYNYDTLKEGLGALPEQFPPMENWEKIEGALSGNHWIKRNIPDLPTYIPPQSIWENVERELSSAKVIKIQLWKYAVAASIFLTIGSTLFYFGINKWSSAVTYTYGEETVPRPSNYDLDWSDDEVEFQKVLAMYEENEMLKQTTVFQNALVEWKELREAKAALKQINTEYNNSSNELIRHLKNIENQRTQVIQNLVAYTASY